MKRSTPVNLWGYSFFIGFVFMGELFLAINLYEERISWVIALAIHLGVLATAFWLFKMVESAKKDIRFYAYSLIMLLFLGPFGAAISLVSILIYLHFRLSSNAFGDLMEELFPDEDLTSSVALYKRIVFGKEVINAKQRTTSFHEIMIYGSEDQKRDVIEKILKHFTPEFAPALLLAMKDKSNAIRVQAATAVTTIEEKLMVEYQDRDSLISEQSSAGDYLAMAKHCQRYLESKLLDQDQMRTMTERSINCYEKYLDLKPDELPIYVQISKLYQSLNEFHQAEVWIEKVIELKDETNPEVLLQFLTLLFIKKDYEAIRELVYESNGAGSLKEVKSIWAGNFIEEIERKGIIV